MQALRSHNRQVPKTGPLPQGGSLPSGRAGKNTLADVPEEYRELFRAAQVLFDESLTDETLADEYVIIPTLAFAANLRKTPQLAFVRDKFAEVQGKYEEDGNGHEAWKSAEWMELETRFFLNLSTTLQALDMKNGVLIVRSNPIHLTRHEDEETGLIDAIEIRVREPWVAVDRVAGSYERFLKLSVQLGQRAARARERGAHRLRDGYQSGREVRS
jgi:hypothetical protein